MEKFINDLEKKITTILNGMSTDKYDMDEYCLKFIKKKNSKFFTIYFNLARENKLNLKNFIQTELDDHYKKYEPENYIEFKSFQKFQLDELEKYQNQMVTNKNFRELKQTEYITDIKKQLELNGRCFIKAPTGFGKTVLYYKTIGELNCEKILFLTPRKMLNVQIVDDKYMGYLNKNNQTKYKIIHYSDLSDVEKKYSYIKKIKKYQKNDKKFILTSCYQSKENLLKHIQELKIKFDLVIFDEAHTIENENWENSSFITDLSISKYRIFGSATPTEYVESKPEIFGNIVEKVKIYELINNNILTNIVTLVKKLNNYKEEYHNLKDLITESMVKFNKKKGLICVNSIANAQKLYNLMNTQTKINTYIFVSGDVQVNDVSHTSIKKFESDTKTSVIIAVGKISYGYDNPLIDFICLGDPKYSDIDIRQTLGRGLRWNKDVYPNKLLHVLIPIYKDEFGKYPKNEALKKYLDYIIGECGKDIILKNTNIINGDNEDDGDEENKKQSKVDASNYDGITIPTDILHEYCTTGYTKFTDFMRFLRKNECWDESTYNGLWEKNKIWMCEIGKLKDKYPKFSFQQIYPYKDKFYKTKDEAVEGIKKATIKLNKQIGKERVDELTQSQLNKKICKIDEKIPLVNLDLYY